MTVNIIFAIANNRVIGNNGALPWPQIQLDMQHFRKMTMGHTVVMGRKTWDSLPTQSRPLPGRRNIVVTRNPASVEGVEAVDSVEKAIRSWPFGDVWVIGGAEIYAAALPFADSLYETRIFADFEGDVFMPPVPDEFCGSEFHKTLIEITEAGETSTAYISFTRYDRRRLRR